ncbi:MAG: bifunctional demethylmenaquinone methyltransferase/2-methoxy-6-polyprenyl-1,4-benzoquinol methylase UbiE [Muribaculaceae bacterium]|nr:bifunctional demethylmenaquinone methyltransferase/2-methoxy-6-polyprenyl-1,4-benzoquinol methylase UbiE [Muribaculaceae bacterium]
MKSGAEKINPYDADRPKTEQVRDMFDSIAPAYDFMNKAMSFGIHRHWLAKGIKAVVEGVCGVESSPRLLDVATGTGDVAISLATKLPHSTVVGIDLSENMIKIGRQKVAKAGLAERIKLQQADCLQLPFADNEFDAVTVAYGVRNFERLADGYREMARVLRPGGTIMVIELSTPTSKIVRPFYNFYTRHIIPLVGRLVSHDVRAYSYLPESIAAVAQREEMTALMESAGFADASYRRLTFGTCTIYTARKP